MKVLVIGSLNMDLVVNVKKLPLPGETIYGNGFSTVCGGKGANQAIASAKMGNNVKMLGSVGSDIFGEKLKSNLGENGADTAYINVADTSTGIAVITVCNGDNSIILDKGANEYTNEELISANEALFDWADVIIFQFEIPYSAVVYGAELAHKHGKKVILNPAPIREITKELAENVDILIPNEHEAAGIVGFEVNNNTAEKAVKALNEMGFSQVLITLGKHGSIFNDGDKISKFGIFDTKVVDTTAAGDSFIAGLCAALGENKTMSQAVRFASAVSAIVVTKHGAGTSIPSRTEVDKFLETADKIYTEL